MTKSIPVLPTGISKAIGFHVPFNLVTECSLLEVRDQHMATIATNSCLHHLNGLQRLVQKSPINNRLLFIEKLLIYDFENYLKLEKLPNLPIRFEEGSCYAYTSTDAMICSSKYYQGTSNAGRECYHTTDGKTYNPTGYLQYDHHRGKMVKAPLYSGEDSVLMIGGINSSCTIEEYSNGGWNRKSHCAVGGVVGFRKVLLVISDNHSVI